MRSSVWNVRKFAPLAMAIAAVGVAQGASWSYKGTGDWTVAGNWESRSVPTVTEDVTNNCGGTMVIADGMDITAKRLYCGSVKGTSGNVLMTGGKLTLKANASQIGSVAGGSGTFTMTGGELYCPQLQIGAFGTGEMTVSGGRVVSADYSCIGRYAGGKGKVTISNGGEIYCQKLLMFVAEEGEGELVIDNGGKFTFAPDNSTCFVMPNNAAGRGTTWLKTGGTLATRELRIQQPGSRFILDGGTIIGNAKSSSASDSNDPLLGNKGLFEVTRNGGTIDTMGNNRDVWIGVDAYEGATGGTIVKKGAGKLTLHYPGTYKGGYDIQEGSLSLASPYMLAGYATAPMNVAAGAKLILGADWSDAQVDALTNRSDFVMAEGAALERAAHDPTADIVISTGSSGYEVRIPAGTVFGSRLKKTGQGTLKIEGPCEFKGGVLVTSGVLAADYETSGLKETHLVLNGASASDPAFLRVMGNELTAPIGTEGAGTIEIGAYAGIFPGAGDLTVNFFGDGRMLKSKVDGFNSTDLILNDDAAHPLHFKNAIDLNGNGNFTLKCRNGSTTYVDGLITNTTGNAQFNSWDGKLVFGDVPGAGVDFFTYRLAPRSGTVLFSNAVIRTSNDFMCGASDGNANAIKMTLVNCDKNSTGGWDYIVGSTGTVLTVDGGKFVKPGRLNLGYIRNGKTGDLVVTNDAQVAINNFYQFSGNVHVYSGQLKLNDGYIGYGENSAMAGAGLSSIYLHGGQFYKNSGSELRIGSTAGGRARFLMTGGEFYAPDGQNVQVGAYGRGLFWQTGGSVSVASYPCVGRFTNGVGEVRLHGGTFLHRKHKDNNNNLFFVSEEGTGVVSVANGGRFETQYSTGVQISSKGNSNGTLILSPGGTVVATRLFGATGSKDCGVVFNGGTFIPRTNDKASELLASNLRRVTVTPYGGAIDTDGKGDFTLKKVLTAAATPLDLSETIYRRWTFANGSLVDSIGGKEAVLTGDASSFERLDGTLRLKGADCGKGCVLLGKDLIPTDGRGLTIEMWFTPTTRKDWARLFNFGKDGHEMYLAHFGPDGMPRLTINGFTSIIGTRMLQVGKPYHVAVVIGLRPDDQWEVRFVLTDAVTGEVIESRMAEKPQSGFSLASISQATDGCWLGHSSFVADKDPAVDYHDIRIHHRAMTTDQIAASVKAGAHYIYAFRKQGAGKLTLTGANSYACGTAVDQGTLALADDATLPATEWIVAKGATLQLNGADQSASMLTGEGTIRDGAVAVTGTIQPGGIGAVGTLTLDGTALSGGELVVDVDGAGEADCLNVTGSLDLTGMTLRVADSAMLDKSQSYTVVTAGGISGAFSNVSLPRRWEAVVVGNTVKVMRKNGTAILVK